MFRTTSTIRKSVIPKLKPVLLSMKWLFVCRQKFLTSWIYQKSLSMLRIFMGLMWKSLGVLPGIVYWLVEWLKRESGFHNSFTAVGINT